MKYDARAVEPNTIRPSWPERSTRSFPIGSPIELLEGSDFAPRGPHRFEVEDVMHSDPNLENTWYSVRLTGDAFPAAIPARLLQSAPPFPPFPYRGHLARPLTLRNAREAEAVAIGLATRIQTRQYTNFSLPDVSSDQEDFLQIAMSLASWAMIYPGLLVRRLNAMAARLSAEQFGFVIGGDVQLEDRQGQMPRHAVVTAVHTDDGPAVCEVRNGDAGTTQRFAITGLGPPWPFPPVVVHAATYRSRWEAEHALIEVAAVLEAQCPLDQLPEHLSHDAELSLRLDLDKLSAHLARWFAAGNDLTGAQILQEMEPKIWERAEQLRQSPSVGTGQSPPGPVGVLDFPQSLQPARLIHHAASRDRASSSHAGPSSEPRGQPLPRREPSSSTRNPAEPNRSQPSTRR
ncbi:hypothetical protein AB0C84_40445 [Actinomadura sp. NPDC048955]|uniref:hypothetical protein n=1 Tax=Actinomadura sp. NPDC048955 TaxID=3158228 RepID=UPI00340C9304